MNVKCPLCGEQFQLAFESDALTIPVMSSGNSRRHGCNKTIAMGDAIASSKKKEESTSMNISKEELTTLVSAMVSEALASVEAEDSASRSEQTLSPEPEHVFCKENDHENEYTDADVNSVSQEMSSIMTSSPYAKNSKFYGKMFGGQVFDPYTDRRWIPAKFYRMYDRSKNENIDAQIRLFYPMNKALDVVRKELDTLIWLKKNNQIAFEERCLFFTVKRMAGFFMDYLSAMQEQDEQYIKDRIGAICDSKKRKKFPIELKTKYFGKEIVCGTVDRALSAKGEIVMDFSSSVELENRRYLYKDYHQRLEEIRSGRFCCTDAYVRLHEIISGIPFRKLDIRVNWDVKLYSKHFMEAFKAAGAYYTMKNLICHENLSFKGYTGEDAVLQLRAAAQTPYNPARAYVLYAMFKEMVHANRFEPTWK